MSPPLMRLPLPKRWGVWLAGTVLAIVCALGAYLYSLNRLITDTFEGRRWTVPARVYAQPLELYPGAPLLAADLMAELGRLGYDEDAALRSPGAYWRRDRRLDVYLRAFTFPEGPRASQRIRIEVGGNGIGSISDSAGRPIPLIRLDPLSIGHFFPSHGEDRLILAPEQIPGLLTETLIAVEDGNYQRHPGFDLKGILRALWVNVSSGEIRQGGSTLTQQLVKSYYLDNRQTIGRKLKELAMAVMLELKFSKEELLNAYVNEIYLGQDGARAVHGFGLGAQFYFNRPLGELSTGEVATLVAIIRGPSYYNPYRHPDRTRARRDLVLRKMHQAELIDAETLTSASAAPLAVVAGARSGGAYYPAFMDLVRTDLSTTFADEDLTGAGLTVFTTLSPRTQDAVNRSLEETLTRLEEQRLLPAGELQAAVTVAATQTGEIEAIAGGRAATEGGFNRALNARRPIGSMVKPVVYLTALEQGMNLATPIPDQPVTVELTGSAPWTPGNFDGEVHGPVPLVRALGDSLNLATVNLGLSVGLPAVSRRFAELNGRYPSNPYPSLLLGAEPMTPLEVLSLYGTFASGGFRMTPRSVVTVLDEHGAPLARRRFGLERRIAPDVAAALARALEITMQKGTGRGSRFAALGTAGKTGTSDDYRDSWFAGFDSQRLAVVWIGYDDNRSTGMSGAAGALKVWDALFARLGVQPLPAPAPDWRELEYASGLLANAGCADVVALPLPDAGLPDRKPGCGMELRRVADKLGRTLREWFE